MERHGELPLPLFREIAPIKRMRIFYAFLIILCAVILWMLPVSDAIYDFRTELRTDTFSTTTGATTSANLTLLDDIYGCPDIESVDVDSDNVTDTPVPVSANCTTRVLLVDGLSTNITRILDVTYDVNALEGYDALSTLLDRFPWIWMLIIISFAPVALVALFLGRT